MGREIIAGKVPPWRRPRRVTMVYDDPATAFALDAWEQAGRDVALVVQGQSMLPLIRPGDEVVVKLLGPQELKPGDVIALLAGNRVVVHRLLKKREDCEGWWCCEAGDNAREWQWLPGGKVLGKVSLIQGPGRTIQLDVRPWPWLNGCFGLVLSFFVSLCESLQNAVAPVLAQKIVRVCFRLVRKIYRTLCQDWIPARNMPE